MVREPGPFTNVCPASWAPPHPIPLPLRGRGDRNGSLSLGEGEGRGEGGPCSRIIRASVCGFPPPRALTPWENTRYSGHPDIIRGQGEGSLPSARRAMPTQSQIGRAHV